jgi:iron complex outermembrane receptor protein
VSRQYLDNTECKDRSLPAYTVANASVSYTINSGKRKEESGKRNAFIKEVVFGLNFNNIFNQRYAASGWVYSAIYASGGHPNDNRYYQIGFIPMAGFTMQGNVTLRF